MAPYCSIGLMSGTSGDGVDAILLAFDDVARPHLPRVLGKSAVAFAPALRAELVAPDSLRLARLTELHFLLPELYAQAVRRLPDWQRARCVGMHGQTVAHQVQAQAPAQRGTLQLGSSAALAAALGLPVVGDMRAVDVALGGQGAPLVPFAHWFFCAQAPYTLVVNFGGICNLTLATPAAADVVGYDVGPGMMLSDAWAVHHSQGALGCDEDGTLSADGRRIEALYAELLAHPFVLRTPPKSAGREQFGRALADGLWRRYGGHPPKDVAYTLLEASVGALVHNVGADARLQRRVRQVVVAGGGAYNPTLVALMRRAFAPLPVTVHAEGVLAPQNHEAAAMALIAARTMHGLPSSLPNVTGARHAAVLGHVHAPPRDGAIQATQAARVPSAPDAAPGGGTPCGPVAES